MLLGFLATGPGTAGLEVVFHLRAGLGPDHARAVHMEAAGAQAHADHCQLGSATVASRLPARGDIRLRTHLAPVVLSQFVAAVPPATAPRVQSFPRAPPALS